MEKLKRLISPFVTIFSKVGHLLQMRQNVGKGLGSVIFPFK